MVVGVAVFVVGILIVVVWLLVEMKRMRHKIFAIFLIALILFTYLSFYVALKGKDINYTTLGGWTQAGKLYFNWLGGMFGNMKSITGYAVKMDWKPTNSTGDR